MLPAIHDEILAKFKQWSRPEAPWWEKAAMECLRDKRAHLIPTRAGDALYLARFWLHEPRPAEEDNGPSKFESANSCVLHWFCRPDDDTALHCHPWSFTSLVLNGAYLEYLPPDDWTGPLGPKFGAKQIWRTVGNVITHDAGDLHTVARVLPDTWTMVRMGDRVRPWGFHPEGREWMGRREFISMRRKVDA